ncbi:MAG: hypothetical protein H6706_28530 [Myxococcales bacterium]|nr:hypothetical protein [Myxococcales bacterium]
MTYQLRARTWVRLVLYAAGIAAVFAGVGAWLASHDGQLKEAVLRFFLPDEWMFAGEHLLERFITPQSMAVLVNAAVTGTVVLVSLCTFPLKEWLSAAYEQDTGVTGGQKAHAPPLWEQALEELKLLLFYAALSLTVLRLGHEAPPALAAVALVLSNGVLFTTVAIDFASPTLARHGIAYADIVRVLASRPLRSLAFGAVFGLPPVAVGWAVVKLQLAADVGFALLAVTHLLTLTVAVLAGTVVGGTLLERARKVRPIGPVGRGLGWLALVGLLTVNGLFFGAAANALLHVSPVLKCSWSVVPDTFSASLEGGFLSPAVRLDLAVEIENPTGRTAAIGDNRVEFFFGEHRVATTQLPRFEVPAGGTARQALSVTIKPKGGLIGAGLQGLDALRKGDGIWDTVKGAADLDRYRVMLILPTPSGEFPITLFGKPPPRP